MNKQSQEFEAAKALKNELYDQAFQAGKLMQALCKHNWRNSLMNDNDRVCEACGTYCDHPEDELLYETDEAENGERFVECSFCGVCGKSVLPQHA